MSEVIICPTVLVTKAYCCNCANVILLQLNGLFYIVVTKVYCCDERISLLSFITRILTNSISEFDKVITVNSVIAVKHKYLRRDLNNIDRLASARFFQFSHFFQFYCVKI